MNLLHLHKVSNASVIFVKKFSLWTSVTWCETQRAQTFRKYENRGWLQMLSHGNSLTTSSILINSPVPVNHFKTVSILLLFFDVERLPFHCSSRRETQQFLKRLILAEIASTQTVICIMPLHFMNNHCSFTPSEGWKRIIVHISFSMHSNYGSF